jgi:hypothetical protein
MHPSHHAKSKSLVLRRARLKRWIACLAVTPILGACRTTAQNPDVTVAPPQWRADLEFLKVNLPKRHINAFHAVSRQAFEAAIDDLEARAEQNADARLVGLLRVLNLIGDGHTGLRFPPDRAYLPIEIQEFGGELRVTRAAAGFEQALGAQVLKINASAVGEVMNRALELTPADENVSLRRALAVNYLTSGLILHGLNIIPERVVAPFTFRSDDGHVFTMDLPSSPVRDQTQWARPNSHVFLFDQHPAEPFWCVSIAAARTVYCDFRSYQGLHGRSAAMLKLIAQTEPEKVVIDMRDNGGGDNTVGKRNLIAPIERLAAVNRKGHLFILIGPQTFSAAMNNAAQFRSQTAATLVGETIGEKPNSFQEPREMRLPNSKLVIRYSTRWYAFVKDGPNAVEPDVPITRSWTDYTDGQDSTLNYALSVSPR